MVSNILAFAHSISFLELLTFAFLTPFLFFLADYGYTNSNDVLQPQRFATLLLYLNEPEAGGETTFPRWINAETREALKAKPQRGKAVLFYSFLPDGNMDDLSQHSAAPVIDGEKWMINLWVRDPIHS